MPLADNVMSAPVIIVALSAILAACGGGGSSRPPPNADGDAVADSGDCAPNDASRWQLLAFQSTDSDADGHKLNASGQLCSGAALPSTHFAAPLPSGEQDCDDASASIWRLLPYTGRDADADGFNVAITGSICSGDSLRAGFVDVIPEPATRDCDDTNAAVWRLMMTFQDGDGDGVGSGKGTVTCVGLAAASGSSLYGYDPLDDPSDPNAALTSNVDLPSWLLRAL